MNERVEVNDMRVAQIIDQLRHHRATLDELNAEYKRIRAERKAQWNKFDETKNTLQSDHERENRVLRRKTIGTINGLHVQLHELLGIGTTKEDFENYS